MKNRFFSYLLCAFIHTLSFLPYAFSMEFYERSDFAYCPHVVVIMGENEKDNNKVASLLMKNDSNIKLGDINITKFDPMEFYGCNNNPNLKVIVITYNPIIDNDFNKIPSIFKNNFDGMDIIIHVGDKNTFTFSKIKSFYDKLNEAWVGKDLYKTMVYSTNSEDGRMKMWYYLLAKYGRGQGFVPRQFFPIYNGTEKGLKNQSDYIQLNNYISRMPDARSIYAIDLNDKNATLQPIIEAMNGTASLFAENECLDKVEALKKKKTTKRGLSIGKQPNSRTIQNQMLLNQFHNQQRPRIQNNIMNIIPPTTLETIFKGPINLEITRGNGKLNIQATIMENEEIKAKYDCCHIF